MQDHPTAPELLEAVAEYLAVELREVVPREQRFKTLVAANLCAVVARELRAGDAPDLADAELFRSLLGAAGSGESGAAEAAAAVAARIRAGGYDDRLPELLGALRAHVSGKLDVARPGYQQGTG
jgi:uncharacterized protein DUF6285